jgi:SAM-dependent methyltransferase
MSEQRPERDNTPWLEHYRESISASGIVLDLGCGLGNDSCDLFDAGFQVIAMDLDPARVSQVPAACSVGRLAADIRHGLPFCGKSFDGVLASLSLHYFRLDDTERAMCEIARVLKPGGWFLFRVNAVGDVNFGYGEGEKIERSVFINPDGRIKRFFDEPMVRQFIEPCFRLERITPRTILQRGIEKRTLECLARIR